HGGVFIFLADARHQPGYMWASCPRRQLQVHYELDWDNWGCLSALEVMRVTTDYGVEMEPATTEAARVFPLARHLRDGQFRCVMKPPAWLEGSWLTLATSKYGDPVAGVLGPTEEGEGWIIL